MIFEPYFATDEVGSIFSDRFYLQCILDFEAALARGQAGIGILSSAEAEEIAKACDADLYDVAALAEATAKAGNPAIPLVKALTAKVHGTASRYVHWGATSQDTLDTALVLQLRAALAVIERDLGRLAEAVRKTITNHRHTVMAGRTWLQQALPITFGLKAAGWLSALVRHRERLDELRRRVLVLQLGGAAGTLASLGEKGPAVVAAVAQRLGLGVPDLPWHGSRDRIAEAAGFAALLVGTLGKIARDTSLLMQTEIAEVFEKSGPGVGGSSTMPHKRNPALAAAILAAATVTPSLAATIFAAQVQEHERAAGPWQAEWRTVPELFRVAAGALANSARLIEGLEIDPERMRANLDAAHGLPMSEAVMMALGPMLGRLAAHDRIEDACRRAVAEKRPLVEILSEDGEITRHLPAKELRRLLDPAHYLGATQSFIDRALAEHARVFPHS